MREFKIYYDGTGPDTLNFRKFARELEKEINSDKDIIDAAKKANRNLAEKAAEILSNPENAIYSGAMIGDLYNRLPRYHYIKHVNFNDCEYEIEIDLLLRQFAIIQL